MAAARISKVVLACATGSLVLASIAAASSVCEPGGTVPARGYEWLKVFLSPGFSVTAPNDFPGSSPGTSAAISTSMVVVAVPVGVAQFYGRAYFACE
ncbi:MAG: hypothetical protein AAB368_03745, partial [bacterium]